MVVKNSWLQKKVNIVFLGLIILGWNMQSKAASFQKDSLSNVIVSAQKVNPTTVEIHFSDKHQLSLDFYGPNIFRIFEDIKGGEIRDPEAKPPAKILTPQPRKDCGQIALNTTAAEVEIKTAEIAIRFNKADARFEVLNLKTGNQVLQSLSAISISKGATGLTLKENPTSYYYGGGVQNGRFSHKGQRIAIENQNSWTDGGVASPNPYFWSTDGYGILFYTFKKGVYDFGQEQKGVVKLTHESPYFDAFFMISQTPTALLNDFYQLTGNPVLLPKFAFYEGHLNAYNRDYWKQDSAGILFEDGKRYKESQKDNGGIKESLNGEKGNYQFSARAVIDRYQKSDMPLGWILPNDGYGAGYGQTSTLDSNIANLKSLGDYARSKGVEIGLWTQSDLHPKEGVSALLQRDIVKEVKDAGVRVLKTDVAWVGAGYSFGLNGVADVAKIVPQYGQNARPFIISLDGWAGTQRYAGIWSGDQTGGNWEYIRFHIPTFIGSGLSGQPNITSDMDGIFGGKNPVINTRGFEWKTFTPMQLNMDGWGSNEKYPTAMGEPTTSINRMYLKLKSALIPYTYSIAKQAVDGEPMVRAMFLEQPSKYTLGKKTQYQFMYGPSFLVAPIYQNTQMDSVGNDIRNNIYLPSGEWVDYFNGQSYKGDVVLNDFEAPIWKLPVFVKRGAIIPMTEANNNAASINKQLRIYELYPYGKSSFTAYDDDAVTEAYKNGQGATTLISSLQQGGDVRIQVQKTVGDFAGFEKNQQTIFKVNLSKKPSSVIASLAAKKLKLVEVNSLKAFEEKDNVYYYNAAPDLNQYATKGSSFEQIKITKNPQLWIKLQKTDVTKNDIQVDIKGYAFDIATSYLVKTGQLGKVTGLRSVDSIHAGNYLNLTWDCAANADFYEIMFEDMRYTHIKGPGFSFDQLTPETPYAFKIRSVNKGAASPWADYSISTGKDPLAFAIKNITAQSSAAAQGGMQISKLFDFDEGNDWHTKYSDKAVPFDVVMDLHSVNVLDKLQYLPRLSGSNGIIMEAAVYYSMDKNSWTKAGDIHWQRNNSVKDFMFTAQPTARYIKIEVKKAVGDFGSGRELYIFKVPGSNSYLPGDINNDHIIDQNDLTSYMNYTGLRKGDADFEGYISNGDLNKNGLIDAYDISVVATALDGGVSKKRLASSAKLSGQLSISVAKTHYEKGETISLVVKGEDLKNVNALSFALPYKQTDMTYSRVHAEAVGEMENLTNDRLHSNGEKILYPTFVNQGDKPLLEGSQTLFVIEMKAAKTLDLDLKANQIMLVSPNLEFVSREAVDVKK